MFSTEKRRYSSYAAVLLLRGKNEPASHNWPDLSLSRRYREIRQVLLMEVAVQVRDDRFTTNHFTRLLAGIHESRQEILSTLTLEKRRRGSRKEQA